MGDLFDSDSEEEATKVEFHPETTKEDSLFDSEDDSEDDSSSSSSSATTSSTTTKPIKVQQKPAKIVNVALRPCTSFAAPNPTFDVIQPGNMFVNPHRFDSNTYNREEEDKAFEKEDGSVGSSRPEVVRWRHKAGTTVPESNARVIVWSDNTMSMIVGGNPSSNVTEIPTASEQSFVYVRQIYDDGDGLDTCLECAGPVGRVLSVRSVAAEETSIEKVMSGMGKGGPHAAINIKSTSNPLKDKIKRENDADVAINARNRQKRGAAGMHRNSRAGLKREQNRSYLEGSDDEEDEYSHMNSKELDDDEDSEEEEMESLAVQREQRQSRRAAVAGAAKTKEQAENAAGDGEGGGNGDDDDDDDDDDDEDFHLEKTTTNEEIVQTSTTGKKRKLEDDDDDDDDDDEEEIAIPKSNKRSRTSVFDDDDEDD